MLGQGSFSQVYESEDKTGKKYAVKIEEKSVKIPLLEKEAKIHMILSKNDLKQEFVVPVYGYHEDEKRRYLMMEKLYLSLGDILKKIDIPFDDFSVKNIGYKLIDGLNFIHSMGICHGDIKPDNVLISEDYLKIYFMDFGLAKIYMRSGKHLTMKLESNPSGTLRYMSVNVNNNVRMSRRDDLISLGYMLIYLQKKILPWQSVVESNKKEKFKKVGEIKMNCDFKKLCDGCYVGLWKYIDYCYKLEYDEKPDYEYLKSIFT